jgi:hypothetical protein
MGITLSQVMNHKMPSWETMNHQLSSLTNPGFSADEDVEVGDYSYQMANNPELAARKSEFYKEVDEALKKLD